MNCQRCGENTPVNIMSMFDQTEICAACKRAERLHPYYGEAVEAAFEAVLQGNRSYPGIGLPAALLGGGHYLLRQVEAEPALVVQPPRDRERLGANGVYNIAGDEPEETLCGRPCDGWHYPFRATDLGAVAIDERFCPLCVEMYAGQSEREK